MIDRDIKRCLGQMIKGVQVVAATHDGTTRGYCSHWVTQVAFEEPIVMASVSPKHDTYPLIEGSGCFTVSILAADQLDVGQYFSYPGRKFQHIAPEWLEVIEGRPIVPDCIAWIHAEVVHVVRDVPGADLDHDLYFGMVTASGTGRLEEPPLLYSSRHGWRRTGESARTPGDSVRDRLLARLAEHEATASGDTPG